jgi:transposase
VEIELAPARFVTPAHGRRAWLREGRRALEERRAREAVPIARSRSERQREAIEVVSIDPYEAYRQAIRNELPRAHIVVDHFHLVRGATPRWTQSGASASENTVAAGRREHGARARAPAGARTSTASATGC